MAFTPKTWQNTPSTATPIDANALVDLETRLSDYSDAVGTGGLLTITTKTTDFTIATGELGARYHATSASAITVTVPNNAADAVPIGGVYEIVRRGAGVVQVTPAGGVTLNSAYGYRNLARQYSAATLVKVDTNEWDLHGDLA